MNLDFSLSPLADGVLQITLTGRLDSITSPLLDSGLRDKIGGVRELRLDFSGISYVSSAGLRVVLILQKRMAAQQGKMVLCHVNSTVMNVFSITGFTAILTFEE